MAALARKKRTDDGYYVRVMVGTWSWAQSAARDSAHIRRRLAGCPSPNEILGMVAAAWRLERGYSQPLTPQRVEYLADQRPEYFRQQPHALIDLRMSNTKIIASVKRLRDELGVVPDPDRPRTGVLEPSFFAFMCYLRRRLCKEEYGRLAERFLWKGKTRLIDNRNRRKRAALVAKMRRGVLSAERFVVSRGYDPYLREK